MGLIPNDPFKAGDGMDASRLGNGLAFNLITHPLDRGKRRPDKGDTGVGQCLAKLGVFGEKAIAWMDSLCTCLLDSVEDGGDI